MGLASLVQKKGANPRVNKVDQMLMDMDTEQVDLFRTIIRNELDYSAPMIAEALQADGFSLNADQIRHYRRKLKEGSARI